MAYSKRAFPWMHMIPNVFDYKSQNKFESVGRFWLPPGVSAVTREQVGMLSTPAVRGDHNVGCSPGGNVGHSSASSPHVCPYCNKSSFYSPRDLQRHIRVHTGEKPYKCPHCNYYARLKAHLKSHLVRKHTSFLSAAATATYTPYNAGDDEFMGTTDFHP